LVVLSIAGVQAGTKVFSLASAFAGQQDFGLFHNARQLRIARCLINPAVQSTKAVFDGDGPARNRNSFFSLSF